MEPRRSAWWRPQAWPRDVQCAVALMVVVASLGGWATDIGPWYFSLAQPAWKPPDAWFGPVWMVLYVTTAWAGVRTWRRMPAAAGPARSGFVLVCLLHALLNVLWSVLYFTLRRPDWALVEGVALWLTAAWAARLMSRVDRLSGLLMLPLLLWLAVAWALNAATVRLNPPFGA